jgi:hypothetical protein
MIEKSLLDNPTFTEHAIVKTSIPFLYAKDRDIIIRTKDILLHQGKSYEVVSLNFKKRDFQIQPLWENYDHNPYTNKNLTISIHQKFEEGYVFALFSQPNDEERKVLKAIHTEKSYQHTNKQLQEKYYHYHLLCASYNGEYQPPIISTREDGCLLINEDHYYVYKNYDKKNAINPFSDEGYACIEIAAKKGIKTDYEWKLKTWSDIFSFCLPELSWLLLSEIPDETAA